MSAVAFHMHMAKLNKDDDLGDLAQIASTMRRENNGGELLPGDVVEVEGVQFILIPAGKFYPSNTDEQKEVKDPFLYQMYPTTWGQYRRFCMETGYKVPATPSFPIDDDHPVVNVNFYDCEEYTKWLTTKIKGLKIANITLTEAVLPTTDQQIYASRGTDKRTFPWGDDWDKTKCVCDTTGTKSIFCEEAEKGMSPWGIAHCSGMVWEWSCTPYTPNN